MKPFLCLVLVLAFTGPAFAQAAEPVATEPGAVDTGDTPTDAEPAPAFDRNELMAYPKSVLVNLCLSLQAKVAELEQRTRGMTDVLALRDRVAELEAENETLKRNIVATLPPAPDGSASTGGPEEPGAGVPGADDDKADKAFNPKGFAYKYVIQYMSHYEFGGVYEPGPRSARHLRDRIKILLRVTNTNKTPAHIKYYVEACSNRDGIKVLGRSGQFSATLKPGGFHEPTTELFGDNIAIATDLIRLVDVEMVEATPNPLPRP